MFQDRWLYHLRCASAPQTTQNSTPFEMHVRRVMGAGTTAHSVACLWADSTLLANAEAEPKHLMCTMDVSRGEF
jgi:hypothetical protein